MQHDRTLDPVRPAQPLRLVNRLSRRRPPLGQVLVDLGLLSPGNMLKAVALSSREEARFGEILLAQGMIDEAGLIRGLATQNGCIVADLDAPRPDVRLIDAVGADHCIRERIVPWQRVGGATIVATARPEQFAEQVASLEAALGPVRMAIARETDILDALILHRQSALAERAEHRVCDAQSCRNWPAQRAARLILGLAIGLVAAFIAAPGASYAGLSLLAVAALALNTGLKIATALATFRAGRQAVPHFASRRPRGEPAKLPTISILVPLFREREIAGRLVRRLERLNYPRELLDICLVLEDDDEATRAALDATRLPPWFRRVAVPPGSVRTKPRALNFALDFCRGSIVGIYDAEDAPEPEQLHKVVRRFRSAAADVACLQGVLDFYNSRANWLSRCFTIEYATWFRVILPGLERLGFVIPLGGTTLFFRREALEAIGGWDAHNVTEDADIGLRLARHGYRTEIIPTTTAEEANCAMWPWIRQRSRWIKGFAMTWAVHMRAPLTLLRELGIKRFIGVQMLFLGTVAQFLLAPLLWTFWSLPFVATHPLTGTLGQPTIATLIGFFLAAEVIGIAMAVYAVSTRGHRGLWPWTLTLAPYFALATIAAYKAIFEMVTRPFFWDKTEHGRHSAGRRTGAAQPAASLASTRSRVSNAREMWSRNAASAASGSPASIASTMR